MRFIEMAVEYSMVVEKKSSPIELFSLGLVLRCQRFVIWRKRWFLQVKGFFMVRVFKCTRVTRNKKTWLNSCVLPIDHTGNCTGLGTKILFGFKSGISMLGLTKGV